MPQLDLDSLLCGGGVGRDESKVTFETALSDSDGADEYCDAGGDDDPYAPAESLRLRIGEDIDWSDVGAVLERDDSTKGATNPKSAARKSAAAARSSCAAAGAPKAVAVVIGGLPAAGKVAREHGRRRSCMLGRARVFAREAVEAEPASPKVSCLGGVRSQPELDPAEAGRRGWWPCVLRCCWNPRGSEAN